MPEFSWPWWLVAVYMAFGFTLATLAIPVGKNGRPDAGATIVMIAALTFLWLPLAIFVLFFEPKETYRG